MELCNLNNFSDEILNHLYTSSSSSVFDVDIGDGEPIRKLPHNRSGGSLILFLFPYNLWTVISKV